MPKRNASQPTSRDRAEAVRPLDEPPSLLRAIGARRPDVVRVMPGGGAGEDPDQAPAGPQLPGRSCANSADTPPVKDNRRVLVIDDNRAIHDDFRKILSPAVRAGGAWEASEAAVLGGRPDAIQPIHFMVDSAYQGQEGARKVQQALEAGQPYAMAFVDVRMPPGWDGLETIRRIWQIDPDIQIVVCTAYSDYTWSEVFEKLDQRDGLLILKKPFDVVEAFQLAHTLTEKWRLSQQSRRKMEDLESRVAERTAELAKANAALQAENAERKRTEEQLRVQTTALDAAANAIVITDDSGTIQWVNPAFTALTGYTAEEALGHNPRLLKSGDHDKAFYRNLWQTISSGRVWRGEMTNRRKDGGVYSEEQTIAPVAGGGGKITHYIAIKQDITERRRAEQSLKLFRSLLEQSNDAIEVVDPETGRFLDANEKACAGLGYTREEFLSLKVPDIDPVFDEVAFRRATNKLRKSGPATVESLHRRKDGSTFPVEISLKYIHLDRDFVVTVVRDITERKQAEDLVRASEERYRALFESNPSPMWVYDVDTLSFLAVNAAAIRHYGYSQDEFLAMTIRDMQPAEDIPALIELLAQRTGDLNFSAQGRHCTKDRKLISVETTSHGLTWLGRGARVVLVTDVTERKLADEAIRASERRFASFMDNVPGFAWMKDAEDRYVYANKLLQESLLSGQEWRGRTTEEVWPPDVSAVVRANDQKVIETRAPLQVVEMIGRSPEKRAVLSSKFPIFNEDGEVAFVCAIGLDITERRRTEDRLREQADIINLAHDAIIIRNFEDQRITFWNAGAERLYGWTAGEAVGRFTGELLYADAKNQKGPLETLIATGEFHGELRQVAKSGTEVIVDARATMVRNPDGTPRSVLFIGTDVSGQKNLEMQLLRAQRLESIGTLASGVAHDLNNVLAPILMGAEMLRDQKVKRDPAPLISLIEECARRGAEIVRQVLTFARGVEGDRVLINPSHLIQELTDIAQKTFPKTIKIISQYPDNLWSIKGDPTQLHQVLLNLAVNARDAVSDGGTITVAAENYEVDEHYASMTPGARPGPHIILSVRDTGSGMSRAMIDKIFDPFFTTKEIGKGTGLGLSTALGIVKSHGGFIAIQSEIGSGTIFKIFLPAETSAGVARQAEMSFESLNGNGELILVVDDEEGILRTTQMVLEKHNYLVLCAADGPEALAIMAQAKRPIHAVLTDLSMPYMDGVALIRAIKKMKPGLRFIASTGHEETRSAELQALGVSNLLTKPYDTQALLTKVRDALSGAADGSLGPPDRAP